MRRRYHESAWETHNQSIRAALELELRGQAALYGRRLTYTHLQQLGISVTRDLMYQLQRQIDPLGVMSRTFNGRSVPRNDYTVAGPNRILSVDGHHKMSIYGIEVYAGIDAYSRYV